MDYLKIYSSLICRSKSRNIKTGIERHHIIPKSLGGTNSKSNIAILTPREHYIAHYLLCKIYPTEPKMAYALWFMSQKNKSTTLSRKYKITARAYEYSRNLYSKFREGYTHSEETRSRMKGRQHSPESNKLYSEIQKSLIQEELLIGERRAERLNFNYPWWNNGITELRAKEPPDSNWVKGRLVRNFKWWNNGLKSTMAHNSPGSEWSLGRIYKGIVK